MESKYNDDMSFDDAVYLLLETMVEYVEPGSNNIELKVHRLGQNLGQSESDLVDKTCELVEKEKKRREQEKKDKLIS